MTILRKYRSIPSLQSINTKIACASIGCLLALPCAAELRSIDGYGNNINNPSWGSINQPLLRLGPVNYVDGISQADVTSRPNPRHISNSVFAQNGIDIPAVNNESGFVFQWGQFLDHDLDLTEAAHPTEPLFINVLPGDPVFPPGSVFPLVRSIFDPATGTDANNPRQQINQITAFVDASNVYGSDEERAHALRLNDGSGKLKYSLFNLLPFNTEGLENGGGSEDPELYLAGDVRANEQVGLTAMHTLFMREHNRIATELSMGNSNLTGEQIYQQARAKVGALMQVITYKEFLPAILGADALPEYTGYKPTVNPSISNEFATAAYRFGHSMISPVLFRLKVNGKAIPAGHLSLKDAFFTKSELNPNVGKGIEPLLRGLALVPSQNLDAFVVDDVRNFLFGAPEDGGVDLPALNIQRGRDHGLPTYNQMRVALGMSAATSFADVSSDAQVQSRLQAAYSNVNDIDLWVGGLAEDKAASGLLGPTFRAILIDQFTRLRDGDRFWYQGVYSGEELEEIESTTLKDIIVRNTKIRSSQIQENVFYAP